MNEIQKVQYLVVDTSAFIRNAPLQDIGVNIITEQDVVNEVTNKRQLRRLVVLPYDLIIQNASPESVKFGNNVQLYFNDAINIMSFGYNDFYFSFIVTEFSKKTGDYTSLSATDIKVIALTYQLEKEKVGIYHLKTEPTIAQTVASKVKKAEEIHTPLIGFYMPEKKKGVDEEEKEDIQDTCSRDNGNTESTQECNKQREGKSKADLRNTDCDDLGDDESDYETADSDVDQNRTEDLSITFSKLNCESTEFLVHDGNNTEHNVDDILVPVKNGDVDDDECNEYEEEDDDTDYDDFDDDEDDDSGWITPGNITNVRRELDLNVLEQKPATVACMTMDFAMQNVLKQIGLNVVALDGRIIKQMRTFIFRCYACYKTTSIMTKVFCPSCGNKTLKKVAVTLNEAGNQQIHINFRKPISKKGKKFSLPMPKGGKHASNPVLVEDQPMPDQRPSRLARTKNDPLQDDYIAGYSPFVMRDVYSKSAMLGIRSGGSFKYWMKKNPNECRRRRK